MATCLSPPHAIRAAFGNHSREERLSATLRRPGTIGHLLRALSQASAVIGGLILIGMALMTLASVAGRALFSSPIQGDVEMVQLACVVA